MHDIETGEPVMIEDVIDGVEQLVPKLRPKGVPVPCETARGCPKGHHSKPRGFCPRSYRAFEHFLECRAIGKFPNDSVVRRHAMLITETEAACDRIEQKQRAIELTKANLARLL